MRGAIANVAFVPTSAALRRAFPSAAAAAAVPGACRGAACRHRPVVRRAWRAAATGGGGKDDGRGSGRGAGGNAGSGVRKGFGGAAKAAIPAEGGAKTTPPPPPPGRGAPGLSADERERLEARDASGVSMMDRLQVGGHASR